MSEQGAAGRRRSAIEDLGDLADALLVTEMTNVRYLTGFTGSNAQLLLGADPVFFTDGRYTEQSRTQVPDLERVIYGGSRFVAELGEALGTAGIKRLGVEEANTTLASHRKLAEGLEGVDLVPISGLVEKIRMRKDAEEIGAIARAQRIAEAAVEGVLIGWEGGTEVDLALALEWAVRTGGAQGMAFEVIVASGPHAALPHAQPRDVPVEPDLLLIDIGARVDGYCSDMTRTYLGAAPDPLPEAHGAVVRALEAAVAVIRPGVRAGDVDAAARGVLAGEGLAEAFVHSTGHAVGLDIHEGPRLSAESDDVLEEGMVVTVEPGVYLPGLGGIRVEDLVVVRADGAEVLTALPRGPQRPSRVGS